MARRLALYEENVRNTNRIRVLAIYDEHEAEDVLRLARSRASNEQEQSEQDRLLDSRAGYRIKVAPCTDRQEVGDTILR